MTIQKYNRQKETENIIKRVCVYSLFIFILAVAETSFFGLIDLLPATPDLILAVICAVALTDSRKTAFLTAIMGGVISDAICGVGIYLSPIFYFLLVLILSPIAKKMMKSYLSWLALMPVALILRAAYTLGRAYLFGNGLHFGEILKYAVLPEAVCTLIFSLSIYPTVRLLTRLVKSKQKIHRISQHPFS